MERHLSAIFAADMVGYSRLMEADEIGTIERQKAHRRELIDPAFEQHHGRIVKEMGDGILVEFPSVVDAVSCALAIQRAMPEREAGVDENLRIAYRVGINLGDVVVEDDDLFGDGVNVAARLEQLSEPGGICISGTVHDHIEGRSEFACSFLGEQQLKNISRPVRAYRVLVLADDPAGETTPPPNLALPDKPSIAVLPFDNMSGDPEQEFFADGMSEDIITALSRINSLFVIARNSTFAYKGRATDIRKIARDLGVRYVLEGSVRKSGERLRITGQLIDATNGTHLWADKFDGSLTDVFALQDQVTENVIAAIQPHLRKAEIQRSRRKRPESLRAYDLFLRALPHLHTFRPEPNAEALHLLEQAVDAQPDFAPALANLAWALEQRFVHHWPNATPEDRDRAIELARRAISSDRDDADATSLSGFLLTILGHDHENGLRSIERALEINPNSAVVCWTSAWVYLFCGETEKALILAERLLRISPVDMGMNFVLNALGLARLFLGQFADAAEISSRALHHTTQVDVTYWVRIPALAHLGRLEEAAEAAKALLELEPNASISGFEQQIPFRDPANRKILVDGFRLAGMPE
jgi:adenylate cyclase